jgi:hypothetical protein
MLLAICWNSYNPGKEDNKAQLSFIFEESVEMLIDVHHASSIKRLVAIHFIRSFDQCPSQQPDIVRSQQRHTGINEANRKLIISPITPSQIFTQVISFNFLLDSVKGKHRGREPFREKTRLDFKEVERQANEAGMLYHQARYHE